MGSRVKYGVCPLEKDGRTVPCLVLMLAAEDSADICQYFTNANFKRGQDFFSYMLVVGVSSQLLMVRGIVPSND